MIFMTILNLKHCSLIQKCFQFIVCPLCYVCSAIQLKLLLLGQPCVHANEHAISV